MDPLDEPTGTLGVDRVALSAKLFYGFGSIAEGTKNTSFNVFLLFYYNQVLGLSGTLAGSAIFIALCFDAITDPLIGSISDNTRSRWGRRHPFMYASALPLASFLFMLFNPPELGSSGLFAWLCVCAVGVRASITLYQVPSSAMLPEMTPNYDERTTLVSYRFLFGWTGGLVASLLGYLVFFAATEEFPEGQLNPAAYPGYGLAIALMVFVAVLVCALGTHRLIHTFKEQPERTPFSLRRFAREFRQAFSNRSYLMLVIGSLFASVAGGFNDVVGLYMNTYFWEFTSAQIATLVSFLFVSVVIAFSTTRPLSERYDKKSMLMSLASFAILFGPTTVILRLLGWFPENGDPILLPIVIAHAVILVSAVVSIGILLSSMIADTVDENELDTGDRQEGIFFSAITFTAKATSGLGGLVAGIALDLIAFPTQAAAGAVPAEKVFSLGLVVGPGTSVFFLITLVFIARYKITRQRHIEILAELERRAQDSRRSDDTPLAS
ncbi:MAG: hypothetical protein GY725_16495 [bacterium]|nr:hypothetical protein [bacterium]